MIKKYVLHSKEDNLRLSVAVCAVERPKAIVQFSHGMAEHKERYYPFMEYLAKNGYTCVIHDHRGHGESINDSNDLGYFYTRDERLIAEDLKTVQDWIRAKVPNVPVYLFSHSMGTLVARVFLQKYDRCIDKLVLCGAPTENPLAKVGIRMAKITSKLHGERYRSKLLNNIAFGAYPKFEGHENAWVCSNRAVVDAYNRDPLCHYTFTANGFYNLFSLVESAFDTSYYECNKPELPILMLAGEDDPVIQGQKKWYSLKRFLQKLGYQNIKTARYPQMRHELLNERDKERVWLDVLMFFG